MNTIGENIAALRKQKGFTQEALASAIGVSAQSISKWENNTNMPDIMLLPIIADIFHVDIDTLFGRQSEKSFGKSEDAYDMCCDAMLETMMTCFFRPDIDKSFESSLEYYKKNLEKDNRCRTGIIRKNGVVYYRKEIGGLLLNKPENHWYELLNKPDAIDILELLANKDFRTALAEIIKTQKTVFTIPSLCNRCKIENTAALEELFKKSKLFISKTVDIDSKEVFIYELMQGQRLFLLFAMLTYAGEFSQYEDCYSGYYGDGSYYFA